MHFNSRCSNTEWCNRAAPVQMLTQPIGDKHMAAPCLELAAVGGMPWVAACGMRHAAGCAAKRTGPKHKQKTLDLGQQLASASAAIKRP